MILEQIVTTVLSSSRRWSLARSWFSFWNDVLHSFQEHVSCDGYAQIKCYENNLKTDHLAFLHWTSTVMSSKDWQRQGHCCLPGVFCLGQVPTSLHNLCIVLCKDGPGCKCLPSADGGGAAIAVPFSWTWPAFRYKYAMLRRIDLSLFVIAILLPLINWRVYAVCAFDVNETLQKCTINGCFKWVLWWAWKQCRNKY